MIMMSLSLYEQLFFSFAQISGKNRAGNPKNGPNLILTKNLDSETPKLSQAGVSYESGKVDKSAQKTALLSSRPKGVCCLGGIMRRGNASHCRGCSSCLLPLASPELAFGITLGFPKITHPKEKFDEKHDSQVAKLIRVTVHQLLLNFV